MPISSNSTTMEIPLQCSLDDYEDLCQQVSELTMEEASEELLDAARHGDSDVIRAILSSFDVVNVTDAELSTPLHKACANGHVPCVQLLLTHDATLRPNASGNTPLHWAAANGHDKVVHLLLEHFDYEDIDVLTKNNFGRSALTEGFASDNVLVAKQALAIGQETHLVEGHICADCDIELLDLDVAVGGDVDGGRSRVLAVFPVEDHVVGGEGLAVVPLHAFAQLEDPLGRLALDRRPGHGETGTDVRDRVGLRQVPVHERVIDRVSGEAEALEPLIGLARRQGDVGGCHADAQSALRKGRHRGHCKDAEAGGCHWPKAERAESPNCCAAPCAPL